MRPRWVQCSYKATPTCRAQGSPGGCNAATKHGRDAADTPSAMQPRWAECSYETWADVGRRTKETGPAYLPAPAGAQRPPPTPRAGVRRARSSSLRTDRPEEGGPESRDLTADGRSHAGPPCSDGACTRTGFGGWHNNTKQAPVPPWGAPGGCVVQVHRQNQLEYCLGCLLAVFGPMWPRNGVRWAQNGFIWAPNVSCGLKPKNGRISG